MFKNLIFFRNLCKMGTYKNYVIVFASSFLTIGNIIKQQHIHLNTKWVKVHRKVLGYSEWDRNDM